MAERWAGARLLRLWGGGCAFRKVKKIACNEPGPIAGEKMQRMAISNGLLGAYLCRACSGGTITYEKKSLLLSSYSLEVAFKASTCSPGRSSPVFSLI